MRSGIGETLAAARKVRGIEIEEVEDRLKIRPRYLLAMEREEWEKLPAPSYARAFLRTYADFLGLDGAAMVESLVRRHGATDPYAESPYEQPPAPEPEKPRPARELPRPRLPGPPRRLPSPRGLAVLAAGVVALLLLLSVVNGGDGPAGEEPADPASPSAASEPDSESAAEPEPAPARAEVSFTATGPVWACVVDGKGKTLIDGVELGTGQKEGEFKAERLEMTFGNGQVDLVANGEPVEIDSAADPLGFKVTGNAVRKLSETERPDCA